MLMGFQSFSVCGALRLWLYQGNLKKRDTGLFSRLKWKWRNTETEINDLKTHKNIPLNWKYGSLISLPFRCVIQRCIDCKLWSFKRVVMKSWAYNSSLLLRMTLSSPAAEGVLFLIETKYLSHFWQAAVLTSCFSGYCDVFLIYGCLPVKPVCVFFFLKWFSAFHLD